MNTGRKLRKGGIKRDVAESFVEIKNAINRPSESYLQEGDRVRLNVEAIKSNADWDKMTDRYRRFVDENQNKAFTVEYDSSYRRNPGLVCLAEDESKWLWFEGDLIREDAK